MLPIPRKEVDEVLFDALRAIYRFEQMKVAKFSLNFDAVYLLQFLRRHGPARIQQIAHEMHIPISSGTRLVDRMEKMALVRREKGRKDKRQIWVSLTSKGEEKVHAVDEHSYAVLINNIAKHEFSTAEVASFVQTAERLNRLLAVSDQP
ncbi:MAG TPA: MarR family transcriptional regulator [Desulfosalsimonadaceae bacterium]|nr:MarR family transcriptional regulator [Desulfosalsimonadaceae bacterium]